MNLAFVGIGGAAVGLGIVVANGTRAYDPPSVYEAGPAEGYSAAMARPIDGQLQLDAAVPMREVMRALGEALDREILVHWTTLRYDGLEPDSEIGIEIAGGHAPATVLGLIGEAHDVAFDWRLTDTTLEISTRDHFDRREQVMAAFELGDAIASIRVAGDVSHEQAVESIATLIHEYVEPDNWRANGGEIAALQVVGDKMFVLSPPRLHGPIRWILDELAGTPAQAQGGSPLPRLAPGDVIEVSVRDLVEAGEWYCANRVVDGEGCVDIPVLGTVHASGMTTIELERALHKELEVVLVDPLVAVGPDIRRVAITSARGGAFGRSRAAPVRDPLVGVGSGGGGGGAVGGIGAGGGGGGGLGSSPES